MGKSDIELAVQRHRRARYRDLHPIQSSTTPTIFVTSPGDMGTSMDPETYKAVIEGKMVEFGRILRENEIPVLDQVTPRGNTILHLAALYGHGDLVKRILNHERNILRNWNPSAISNFAPDLSHYQTLLVRPNNKGNLALHVAAAEGHELVVDLLIESIRQLPRDMEIVLGSKQVTIQNILMMTNNEEDTALHLALKGNHAAVAFSLVDGDPRTSVILNKERESPLYMVAEAGHVALVEKMLRGSDTCFDGKSVVHAAIKSKNLAVLDALVERYSDLIDSRDEEGRSPLSCAASIGYDIGVSYLLTRSVRSTQVAYVKDQDGSFPIHSACRKGHTLALHVILQCNPDTIELLNAQGQNVLHAAAESGKADAVEYLLRMPEIENLINEKDIEGNTPLHLATINWHPKVVSLLIWDNRVSLKAMNNKGFTALDAAEEHMASNPSLQQWLIWIALVSAGTTRAPPIPLRAHIPGPEPDEQRNLKKYKDRVNTLLVVATLVATMSFAAGLNVPRGCNCSESNSNVQNSYQETALHAFVISDSIAVYGAVISTVALIGTQLADLKCMLTVFKLVVPLLGSALTAMSLAFVAGLYLVLGHRHWLSIFVVASGSFFLMSLLLLIVPFVSPYTLSPLLFRRVLRYPFSVLLFFADWQCDTDDGAE